MQSVERSFRVVSKGRAFKGICYGAKKSKGWTRCPTLGESSSTPFRSDKSHPCYFKGYFSDSEERVTDSGFGRELSGQATLREEDEVYLGAHCL